MNRVPLILMVRRLPVVFWRELSVLTTAGLGAGMLLQAGFTTAAAVVLSSNVLCAGLLTGLTVGRGHPRRALRWPHLQRALMLSPCRLERQPLRGLADTGEEILGTIHTADPGMQAYLQPARDSTLEVLQRSLDLERLARQHEERLAARDLKALSRQLYQIRHQVADEDDPEVVAQLEETAGAVQIQLEVLDGHRHAMRRIESELEAASGTLAAVADELHQVDDRLAAPAARGPGSLPARRELQARVSSLAAAVAEEGGEAC